jgi:hypothetical protein
VMDMALPILAAKGIAIIQMPASRIEGSGTVRQVLVTRLAHKSGQWVEGTLVLPVADPSPQGLGSAITYARRYMLAAVGVVTDDDDDSGMAEAENEDSRSHRRSAPAESQGTRKAAGTKKAAGARKATSRGEGPPKMSDAQMRLMQTLLGELGLPDDNDTRRGVALGVAKAVCEGEKSERGDPLDVSDDIAHASDLSVPQASKVIDYLRAWHDDGVFWDEDEAELINPATGEAVAMPGDEDRDANDEPAADAGPPF